MDPSSQPEIPPAPLAVVPVSDLNIPVRGSAGAAAAYAMEMSAPAEEWPTPSESVAAWRKPVVKHTM